MFNSPKKSAPKQQEGVAVGVDKAEKGTQQVPRFQRNQQRFQPESTSGRYERPRRSSPRMNNYSSNNFRSQGQHQNRYQNNGGRTFYNNDFKNYQNQSSWNQSRVQSNSGYVNQNSRFQNQNFQSQKVQTCIGIPRTRDRMEIKPLFHQQVQEPRLQLGVMDIGWMFR